MAVSNKKKIGCVLAYCNNYGSMLQCYATIKTLQKLGCDVELIRYIKKRNIFQKIQQVYHLIRIGEYSDQYRALKRKILFLFMKNYKRNMIIRNEAYDRFGSTKIKIYFKNYIGYEELCNGAYHYDKVLVGSDQLWTPMSLYSKYYNLLFVADKIPKLSYASSFGVSSIPKFQHEQTKKYLERFENISVREDSGKKIVEKLSNQKATLVLDPSMLLTQKEWRNEITESKIKEHEPFIFCYFLGTNIEARNAVEKLKELTGFSIIAIRHNDEYVAHDEYFGDKAPYNVSPCDFINYISQAEYICTDSFHCSVFSILFHKKFLTFYRYTNKKGSRNTRIDSLFNMLNIDRLYEGVIDKIKNDIDYKIVDEKLEKLRTKSIEYLSCAIQK